ncbi:MAG TPA: hypothetical protein VNN72_18830 [Polyangiaceae bacterium]|nr:hypothetical protein [Polyangiaceae bacterium]
MRPSTVIFALDAALLALSLVFAPAPFALAACAPAGVLGVVACELLDRGERNAAATHEPWRLDGWMIMVGTLGILGLGASIGPEAVVVAWLLVALLAGLGFASLPNLAPPTRP